MVIAKVSIVLLSIFLVSSEIQIALIQTDKTDADLSELLASNLMGITEEVRIYLSLSDEIVFIFTYVPLSVDSWGIPSVILDENIQVIVDIGNDPSYSQFLADNCLQLGLLHIVMGRSLDTMSGESSTTNTLFVYSSYINEAAALYQLITMYNWKNLAIVRDEDPNNGQMSERFKTSVKSPIKLYTEQILNDEKNLNDVTYRMESTVKFSGARITLVMASSVLASLILNAADNIVMGGSGYVWILNSDAMADISQIAKNSHADLNSDTFGVLKTGAIGILADDAFYLTEQPFGDWISMLSLIGKAYQVLSSPNGTMIYNYLLTNPYLKFLPYQLNFDSNGLKVQNYRLYNIVNFNLVKIGSWDYLSQSFLMEKSVTINWPGFITTIPNDNLITLNLALLYPQSDLDDPTGIINGFQMALEEINNGTSLPGYRLEGIYQVSYDALNLVYSIVNSLESYNVIGYVGPYSSDLAVAYNNYLMTKTSPKPLVSYGASSYLLNKTSIYPYLLRTIQPDGLQASVIANFIQTQGWKEVGVLYTNDVTGLGIYNSFLSNLQTYSISIMNDPSLQQINLLYNDDGSISSTTLKSIDDALQGLIRKQIKIIAFLGGSDISIQLAIAGYNKEYYGSEFFWVGSMWLTDEVMTSIQKDYSDKAANILAFLQGAVSLGFRPPIDTVGANFKANYKKKFNKSYSNSAMLAYDSVYLFANSLETIINQQEDYSNGDTINNALRASDFTGASGSIKISDGTNDRTVIGYSVLNVQNSTLVMIKEYDPLDSFINVTNSIVWGGGSSSPTKDTWDLAYDCPFPNILSHTSSVGVGIVIAIGSTLFCVTLGLSIFTYKKIKQETINEISTKTLKTWKDTLVQLQIVIEFFQFIAIAPYFNSLQVVIQVISNLFMLDIMKITQTNKTYYWAMLSGVCSLCVIWFAMMMLLIFQKREGGLIKKIPIVGKLISLLNGSFLPFLGNTMFLPTLALLLDAFVCDHEVLGKAYVWRDCYMICWQSEHYSYIIFATISIVLYEPLAVIFRPIWQQAKSGAHLKVKPFFLLIKTCVQILLVSIGKSLQGNSPVAHGVVYSILMVAFIMVTYKFKAFNYNRTDLWELTSLVAVAYMAILATLSNSGDSSNIGWFIGLMIGWGLILGWGFLIQYKYYPALLEAPSKHRNPSVLPMLEIGDIFGTLEKKKTEKPSNHEKLEKMEQIEPADQAESPDHVEYITNHRIENSEAHELQEVNSSSSEEDAEAVEA